MKNHNTLDIRTLYQTIIEDPQMEVFHLACEQVLLLSQHYLDKNLVYLDKPTPGINQLYLNGQYYSFKDITELDKFTKVSMVNNGSWTRNTNDNLLNDKLANITKIIMNDNKNSKYFKYFRNILSYPLAEQVIYNYISYLITTGYKHENAFKQTRICIDLGNVFNRFFISQISSLKCIYDCFNMGVAETLMNSKQIITMINICKIFLEFEFETDQIQELFDQFQIKDDLMKKVLYHFFRDLLFTEYENNNLHLLELKSFIKSIYKEKSAIISHNISTQFNLEIGYYYMDFLMNNEIFEETHKFTKKNQTHTTNFVQPTTEMLNHITKKSVLQDPYLYDEQCTLNYALHEPSSYTKIIVKNINNKLHANEKMKVEILKDAYINTQRQFTKLSIDVNFLKQFLMGLTESADFKIAILYILDMSDEVHKLRMTLSPECYDLLSKCVLVPLVSFTEIQTAPAMQKLFRKRAKEMNINISHLNSTLTEFIDKAFQKKLAFIQVLQQAIKFSVFKFYILSEYYDTRLRRYLMDIPLNIHINSFAKAISKMYNYEQNDITSHELNIIKHIIKNDIPYSEIENLLFKSKYDLEKNNDLLIKEYILTFLKDVDIKWLNEVISNVMFYEKPLFLNETLRLFIKSPKKLLLVQSLITFEQTKYRTQHCKHILNYYEKDINNSGFQMMAIFFRSKELAEISSLSGTEYNNIYLKVVNNMRNTYNRLQELCKPLTDKINLFFMSYENLLEELKLKIFTNSMYNNIKESLNDCLNAWISIDLKMSSCSRELALTIIHHLNNNYKEFFNSIPITNELLDDMFDCMDFTSIEIYKSFSSKNDFRNLSKELKFILCLRLAVRVVLIGDKIIGVDPENPSSILRARETAKQMVMTLVYMSTAYGRKDAFMDLLKKIRPIPDNPPDYKIYCREFASFLDKSGIKYLNKFDSIKTIYHYLDHLSTEEPVTITNRNMKLTINPKVETYSQISCPSYFSSKKRPAQLTMKLITTQMDTSKLKSMFMANLAHVMDADLMHYFVEICLEINKALEENGYSYRIIFERNHDCFIINCPILLDIVLKEAYLRFIEYPYLSNITPHQLPWTHYEAVPHKIFIAWLKTKLNPYAFK